MRTRELFNWCIVSDRARWIKVSFWTSTSIFCHISDCLTIPSISQCWDIQTLCTPYPKTEKLCLHTVKVRIFFLRFSSFIYSYCLQLCLAQSRYLVNIYWVNKECHKFCELTENSRDATIKEQADINSRGTKKDFYSLVNVAPVKLKCLYYTFMVRTPKLDCINTWF